MPKHHKSCDDSSSGSEDCYKVVCEPKCFPQCADIPHCPVIRPEEIACRFKNAVVEVHSEFLLAGADAPAAVTGATGTLFGFTGGSPLADNARADVFVEGNGFFIKGHYIICPAHLVLMPPSLTAVAQRYPFYDNALVPDGLWKDSMTRASRILVSVFNVNGKGHSFVYDAELVGVDGAGNVAVLRIDMKKQWNRCSPCVEKCHPYFCFGSSRAAVDGQKIYMIGDFISNSNILSPYRYNVSDAIIDGLLADHRYVEYTGHVLSECVLVSAPTFGFAAGLPILDGQGHVLGMQTTDIVGLATVAALVATVPATSGFVAGPSEFAMRRVIKEIIKGTCARRYNYYLETICDPAGAYYRYRKAYLGVGYRIFTGLDYDTVTDYTSVVIHTGGTPPFDAPTWPYGSPRVRLDLNGDFLYSPVCKELIGLQVLSLAGLNPDDGVSLTAGPSTVPIPGVFAGTTTVPNGFYYTPGGTGAGAVGANAGGTIATAFGYSNIGIAPPFLPQVGLYGLPVSPLINKLQPGDVITHAAGVPLGDLEHQIALSLVTWRLSPGDLVELTYRRGGNALNTADSSATDNYDGLYSMNVCTRDFPRFMDYPWYALSSFPNILADGATVGPTNYGFEGGTLEAGQQPQIEGGSWFQPAL